MPFLALAITFWLWAVATFSLNFVRRTYVLTKIETVYETETKLLPMSRCYLLFFIL